MDGYSINSYQKYEEGEIDEVEGKRIGINDSNNALNRQIVDNDRNWKTNAAPPPFNNFRTSGSRELLDVGVPRRAAPKSIIYNSIGRVSDHKASNSILPAPLNERQDPRTFPSDSFNLRPPDDSGYYRPFPSSSSNIMSAKAYSRNTDDKSWPYYDQFGDHLYSELQDSFHPRDVDQRMNYPLHIHTAPLHNPMDFNHVRETDYRNSDYDRFREQERFREDNLSYHPPVPVTIHRSQSEYYNPQPIYSESHHVPMPPHYNRSVSGGNYQPPSHNFREPPPHVVKSNSARICNLHSSTFQSSAPALASNATEYEKTRNPPLPNQPKPPTKPPAKLVDQRNLNDKMNILQNDHERPPNKSAIPAASKPSMESTTTANHVSPAPLRRNDGLHHVPAQRSVSYSGVMSTSVKANEVEKITSNANAPIIPIVKTNPVDGEPATTVSSNKPITPNPPSNVNSSVNNENIVKVKLNAGLMVSSGVIETRPSSKSQVNAVASVSIGHSNKRSKVVNDSSSGFQYTTERSNAAANSAPSSSSTSTSIFETLAKYTAPLDRSIYHGTEGLGMSHPSILPEALSAETSSKLLSSHEVIKKLVGIDAASPNMDLGNEVSGIAIGILKRETTDGGSNASSVKRTKAAWGSGIKKVAPVTPSVAFKDEEPLVTKPSDDIQSKSSADYSSIHNNAMEVETTTFPTESSKNPFQSDPRPEEPSRFIKQESSNDRLETVATPQDDNPNSSVSIPSEIDPIESSAEVTNLAPKGIKISRKVRSAGYRKNDTATDLAKMQSTNKRTAVGVASGSENARNEETNLMEVDEVLLSTVTESDKPEEVFESKPVRKEKQPSMNSRKYKSEVSDIPRESIMNASSPTENNESTSLLPPNTLLTLVGKSSPEVIERKQSSEKSEDAVEDNSAPSVDDSDDDPDESKSMKLPITTSEEVNSTDEQIDDTTENIEKGKSRKRSISETVDKKSVALNIEEDGIKKKRGRPFANKSSNNADNVEGDLPPPERPVTSTGRGGGRGGGSSRGGRGGGRWANRITSVPNATTASNELQVNQTSGKLSKDIIPRAKIPAKQTMNSNIHPTIDEAFSRAQDKSNAVPTIYYLNNLLKSPLHEYQIFNPITAQSTYRLPSTSEVNAGLDVLDNVIEERFKLLQDWRENQCLYEAITVSGDSGPPDPNSVVDNLFNVHVNQFVPSVEMLDGSNSNSEKVSKSSHRSWILETLNPLLKRVQRNNHLSNVEAHFFSTIIEWCPSTMGSTVEPPVDVPKTVLKVEVIDPNQVVIRARTESQSSNSSSEDSGASTNCSKNGKSSFTNVPPRGGNNKHNMKASMSRSSSIDISNSIDPKLVGSAVNSTELAMALANVLSGNSEDVVNNPLPNSPESKQLAKDVLQSYKYPDTVDATISSTSNSVMSPSSSVQIPSNGPLRPSKLATERPTMVNPMENMQTIATDSQTAANQLNAVPKVFEAATKFMFFNSHIPVYTDPKKLKSYDINQKEMKRKRSLVSEFIKGKHNTRRKVFEILAENYIDVQGKWFNHIEGLEELEEVAVQKEGPQLRGATSNLRAHTSMNGMNISGTSHIRPPLHPSTYLPLRGMNSNALTSSRSAAVAASSNPSSSTTGRDSRERNNLTNNLNAPSLGSGVTRSEYDQDRLMQQIFAQGLRDMKMKVGYCSIPEMLYICPYPDELKYPPVPIWPSSLPVMVKKKSESPLPDGLIESKPSAASGNQSEDPPIVPVDGESNPLSLLDEKLRIDIEEILAYDESMTVAMGKEDGPEVVVPSSPLKVEVNPLEIKPVDLKGFGASLNLQSTVAPMYCTPVEYVDYRGSRLTIDGKQQLCRHLDIQMDCPMNCNCAREVDKLGRFERLWTDMEKCIFVDKFLQFPKNFSKISSYLANRTTKDCVRFYYDSKSTLEFKYLLKEFDNRRKQFKPSWVYTVKSAHMIGATIYPVATGGDGEGMKESLMELPIDDVTINTFTNQPTCNKRLFEKIPIPKVFQVHNVMDGHGRPNIVQPYPREATIQIAKRRQELLQIEEILDTEEGLDEEEIEALGEIRVMDADEVRVKGNPSNLERKLIKNPLGKAFTFHHPFNASNFNPSSSSTAAMRYDDLLSSKYFLGSRIGSIRNDANDHHRQYHRTFYSNDSSSQQQQQSRDGGVNRKVKSAHYIQDQPIVNEPNGPNVVRLEKVPTKRSWSNGGTSYIPNVTISDGVSNGMEFTSDRKDETSFANQLQAMLCKTDHAHPLFNASPYQSIGNQFGGTSDPRSVQYTAGGNGPGRGRGGRSGRGEGRGRGAPTIFSRLNPGFKGEMSQISGEAINEGKAGRAGGRGRGRGRGLGRGPGFVNEDNLNSNQEGAVGIVTGTTNVTKLIYPSIPQPVNRDLGRSFGPNPVVSNASTESNKLINVSKLSAGSLVNNSASTSGNYSKTNGNIQTLNTLARSSLNTGSRLNTTSGNIPQMSNRLISSTNHGVNHLNTSHMGGGGQTSFNAVVVNPSAAVGKVVPRMLTSSSSSNGPSSHLNQAMVNQIQSGLLPSSNVISLSNNPVPTHIIRSSIPISLNASSSLYPVASNPPVPASATGLKGDMLDPSVTAFHHPNPVVMNYSGVDPSTSNSTSLMKDNSKGSELIAKPIGAGGSGMPPRSISASQLVVSSRHAGQLNPLSIRPIKTTSGSFTSNSKLFPPPPHSNNPTELTKLSSIEGNGGGVTSYLQNHRNPNQATNIIANLSRHPMAYSMNSSNKPNRPVNPASSSNLNALMQRPGQSVKNPSNSNTNINNSNHNHNQSVLKTAINKAISSNNINSSNSVGAIVMNSRTTDNPTPTPPTLIVQTIPTSNSSTANSVSIESISMTPMDVVSSVNSIPTNHMEFTDSQPSSET